MFEKYDISKMPGHWFLSRMGKKVLRPGGKELTLKMINALNIHHIDEVVEFAPGMGSTAKIIFDKNPNKYWGIDQNKEAIEHLKELAPNENYRFLNENIIHHTLENNIATVVLGEAVLTMQTGANKQKIINEAYQVLQHNGRYGIHEICLAPDGLPEKYKDEICKELSAVIHVNARPLTLLEWRTILGNAGFSIEKVMTSPMHLLKPARLLQDEGLKGVARIIGNILKTKGAWKRISSMRAVFNKYEKHMQAVSIIAVKR